MTRRSTLPARRIVVVGNGMTGARFAEEAARRDPDGRRVRVTLVGAEPGPAYNRVLLPGLIDGAYAPRDIALPEPQTAGITRLRGTAATGIDPRERTVDLDTGERLDYDELVLATGARAALPPLRGLAAADGTPAEGVTALRDLADQRRLAHLVRPGAPAVVLGGGVLGLETARALTGAGVRVAVVEAAPWIMRRQIDRACAQVLARAYEDLGVRVHAWRVADRWAPGSGLVLDDGTVLAGDAIVVTAGVRPAVELADKAGVKVEHGVVVDDRLASSEPRIHAIGDCASHPGGGAGLVQPGYEQARVLADLLTGADPAARYTGARPVTRLKAQGIDLTAMGATDDEAAEPGTESVVVSDPAKRRYAKLNVAGGRVSGAVLLGFPEASPEVSRLFDEGAAVPEDRLGLLQGRPEEAGAEGEGSAGGREAHVCRCNAVTRTDIEQAWLDGARTRPAIAQATRATTGCGGCTRDVDALLKAMDGKGAAKVG
ncbi:FAD-dependent oxidoreductase [Nocardiopsis halophila]|uniref:FAD-dependent oxidoreductase n=1 Tax=Nocardiopsis halophila TaxID=141692 RepID=UPI00034DE3C8|nr:FAD-dependent oxidoreductase [Nocardiopsis halophila]